MRLTRFDASPVRIALIVPLLLGLAALTAGDADAGPKPAPSAHPLLWVSKTKPRIYVFGTLELPEARAQALPPVVEQALEVSDAFFTALPCGPADLKRQEAEAKRISALPVEAGGLSAVLEADLYDRAKKLLATPPGISVLESREPWFVRRTVVAHHVRRTYPTPAKLLAQDLWDRAYLLELPVAGLDTVPEYFEVFDGLKREEQVELLKATVGHLEKDAKAEVKHSARLVKAYLAGDVAQVQAIWREALPEGALGAKLEKQLLADRVRRMLGRFAARLKRAPDQTFFLALDAALLQGEAGVLKRLAEQGHELQRLGPQDEIEED